MDRRKKLSENENVCREKEKEIRISKGERMYNERKREERKNFGE